MNVKELISILTTLDPDAEVFVMVQPNYPHQHALGGVAVREDLHDDDEEPDAPAPGTRPNDVFLLEGSWLRYGLRRAWDTTRPA